MEQQDLISGLAIALVFIFAKFIEYKFIIKEEFDVKRITQDTFLVFVSTIVGHFIIGQVDVTNITKTATSVFTGVPDF